jgi:hypothetical protein
MNFIENETNFKKDFSEKIYKNQHKSYSRLKNRHHHRYFIGHKSKQAMLMPVIM